jgi:hypothetical protein
MIAFGRIWRSRISNGSVPLLAAVAVIRVIARHQEHDTRGQAPRETTARPAHHSAHHHLLVTTHD